MTYEAERLAADLRAARKKKGISQRALTSRTGLPQPHISKIENGDANPTITSLTSIANALDLEIALVPRRAMPALRAIIRNLNDTPQPSPEARKEFARIAKQLDRIKELDIDPSTVENLRRSFRGLRSLENLAKDAAPLRAIAKKLRTAVTGGDARGLQEATGRMDNIRDMLARTGMEVDSPRPAYQLDDEYDD